MNKASIECAQCGEPLVVMGEDIEETLVGMETGSCGQLHDDNCMKRTAWCQRGHRNGISIRRTCSACDWRGKEICSCDGGRPKLDAWPDLPIGKRPQPIIAHPDDVPWLR